jgi:hypothetical protein
VSSAALKHFLSSSDSTISCSHPFSDRLNLNTDCRASHMFLQIVMTCHGRHAPDQKSGSGWIICTIRLFSLCRNEQLPPFDSNSYLREKASILVVPKSSQGFILEVVIESFRVYHKHFVFVSSRHWMILVALVGVFSSQVKSLTRETI